MTDEDEAYLRAARRAFEEGRIASNASKRIMGRIKKEQRQLSGLKVVAILRDELDDEVVYAEVVDAPERPAGRREIILSAYLVRP